MEKHMFTIYRYVQSMFTHVMQHFVNMSSLKSNTKSPYILHNAFQWQQNTIIFCPLFNNTKSSTLFIIKG